ncbi:MAG TPA: SAM-dependent methyltransferase [Candidatus Acidoferrales bacterium]|nr:SAM-dependent methyltransferase [Candidatus Acidoferrales bacterium]
MKRSKPFRTSELTAVMRALHQTADDEPKIFADPIAPRLVNTAPENDDWLQQFLAQRFAKTLRSGFLLRNRYAEDCLAEGVERGVQQYLILGAGLDTFAYRQPPWAVAIRIYEIDLPVSQSWKRDRLAAAGIPVPPNLRFVPINFEKISLAGALEAADFDLSSRTFCSWLGVTQYLTPAAIDGTLAFVLSLPRGSEIVFSFILPWQAAPAAEVEALRTAARKAAAVGEPWLSTFRPEDLKAHLRAMGFSNVIHLTPEEAQERYFQNRHDGLAARHGEQSIRAVV